VNKFNTDSLKKAVLFEDDNFMVINKPPGISTLDDRTKDINMLSLARQLYPDIQVCHRLDKETSGALAFAKNKDAYGFLAMQFESRKVEKVYHALVWGSASFEGEAIDKAIHVKGNSVRIAAEGKPSRTFVKTLEVFKYQSLVECRPVTGRTHQVRIHLADSGYPIVADETYGGRILFLSEVKARYNLKKWEEEKPLMSRVALHALSLCFSPVEGGQTITVTAPLPKDFRAVLNQLRKS